MKERWQQLNFITPNIYGREIAPDPSLHSRTIDTKRYFRELERSGEVELTDPHVTALNYVWQYVDYFPKRLTSYSDSFRGYLMVEPHDITSAAKILDGIYRDRKHQGKYGEFKWLMAKNPPILFIDDESTHNWWRGIHDENNLGIYFNLDPIDPRIVLYEHSAEEIQEILSQLAMTNEWKTIEEKRRTAFSDGTPPIRGNNSFRDASGKTWYSLTFNSNAGHSGLTDQANLTDTGMSG